MSAVAKTLLNSKTTGSHLASKVLKARRPKSGLTYLSVTNVAVVKCLLDPLLIHA